MIYTMDDENGNGDGFQVTGSTGNPYISSELCEAYRGHIETKIDTMETKILSAVKLTALVLGLILTSLQLALHFFGG